MTRCFEGGRYCIFFKGHRGRHIGPLLVARPETRVASDRDFSQGFQRALLWANLILLVWFNDPVTWLGLPREAWLAFSSLFLVFFSDALQRMEYGPRKRRQRRT